MAGVRRQPEEVELSSECPEDPEEGLPRRFGLTLLVAHPTLRPADITVGLGLEPHFAHCAGDPRSTPSGTPLAGSYAQTRWRHGARYNVRNQWFASQFNEFISRLQMREAFLAKLRSTGGTATVIVEFLGDGYFGDAVPVETLARLAGLGLELGIECFSVPQS
jgi:hypothetical protein